MTTVISNFETRTKRVAQLGFAVCAGFLGLLFVSAWFLRIDGAVVSPAHVISMGNNRIVQHPDGGSIRELLVENGTQVEAGDVLVVLDSQPVEADFNVATFRQLELRVKLARLKALLEEDDAFEFNWLRTSGGNTRLEKIIATQEKLFNASREAFLSRTSVLKDRIAFLRSEIAALESQMQTVGRQLGVIERQLAEVTPLVKDQLVAKSREWQLMRDQIAAQEQIDSMKVIRVRTESSLNDAENELSQLINDHREKLTAEIEETETELQSVDQSYAQLSDRLTRLEITAPVSGLVHNLQFRNEQAVIQPGQPIMEIVPLNEGYELMARVSPADIDQVATGQPARLRFDAFDSRSTPELSGTVTKISADRLTDDATGQVYFEVSIDLDERELDRLGPVDTLSGMPVTAMLRTRDRSLLSYLVQPVEQQVARAFH
tara:strand:+ start:24418 stop:25716 length:1299 start_codon:yes stop_codon:yes gene_type:complete